MADEAAVKAVLRAFRIELPSWAFGNCGTRFKVFAQPGVPRDPFEKIDDAAQVHRFTGVAPTVAVHIPWDADGRLRRAGRVRAGPGVAIGTVNANVFQDDAYMLGGLPTRTRGAAQGAGPSAGVRGHHGRRPARGT